MTLSKLSAQEMALSLRIPGATQWGKGATSDEPGKHPMNASARLHRRTLHIWPGETPPQISPSSTIFAVGSCFAREIERVLGLKGFTVASLIDGMSEEGIKDVAFTNRYNSASMLLELRRLLEGPEAVPEDALIVEVGEGVYVDAHYHIEKRLSLEDLLARRRRFHSHFQSLRDAEVLFFTLGLNEAAFDLRSGLYRNGSPSVREIRRGAPVEVHTFTTAENVAFLEEIHALVRRHCRKNPRIFVTVSPVPLTLTYQNRDVITASSEGKSILRAAVAEFCAAHSDVTYFYSYEMAMNADPNVVFKGDKRHLNKRFIATIVNAFIERHCEALAQDSGEPGMAEPLTTLP